LLLKNADDSDRYIRGVSNAQVELYHNGLVKLATTSTGIDVTGTVTSDGLNVQNGSNAGITFDLSANYSPVIKGSQAVSDLYLEAVGGGGFRVSTTDKPRLFIQNNGDISFYEDTGTTAKFFWDASAESLGIGTTTAPSSSDVKQVISSTTGAFSQYSYNGGAGSAIGSSAQSTFSVYTTTGNIGSETYTERMRIDSSGNVGIGITPESWSSSYTALQFAGNGALSGWGNQQHGAAIFLSQNSYVDASGWKYISTDEASRYEQVNGAHAWSTAASGTADTAISWSEAMRIDSSGNLLVGRSVFNNAAAGIDLAADGFFQPIRDGSIAARFVRLTSDGDIVQFRKDGSTVGSIGTNLFSEGAEFGIKSNTGQLTLGTTNANKHLQFDSDQLYPSIDGGSKLGYSAKRFSDLYLSGGVYLGGTGSANKLEDYEEGTWTPTPAGIYGFTPGGSAVYSGNYVKIGNLVHVNCSLDFDTSETLALGDRFILQGIPFTMTGNKNGVGGGSFIQPGSFSSGTHAVGTVASNSQSQDEIMCVVTRVNGTPPALNNTNVNCSITYRLTNTFA
jgi:hypothetical protein